MDRVLVEIDAEGIAHVRMNRPDKLNALDAAMFDGLWSTARELARDRSLRAVVLSGEGRAFCAGLDFSSFASMSPGTAGEQKGGARGLLGREAGSMATRAQDAGWLWHDLPVPVIAAIHGPCFGGGLQIALGADVRFIAPSARMSVMEIKWGLIPDMSGTQTLRHQLRLDVLKELTYTGRIVQGTEAVALGLATHLSDHPQEAATELAREIAGRSPSAVRAGKKLLNRAVVSDERSGLALEARLQAALIGKANQVEAVRANLEKRDPAFVDPVEPELEADDEQA